MNMCLFPLLSKVKNFLYIPDNDENFQANITMCVIKAFGFLNELKDNGSGYEKSMLIPMFPFLNLTDERKSKYKMVALIHLPTIRNYVVYPAFCVVESIYTNIVGEGLPGRSRRNNPLTI